MFEVASSRIRIRGSASRARAIEISWRSPADSPAPPSRTVCAEPGLEAARDPVDADGLRDVGDHLVGRLRPREADVVGDRAREQERVLEHHAELAPVRAQLELAQVVTVDPDRAVVRVVEAADELRGRRLAAA